ncbi:MAG: hypothetical protein AAF135_03165 [Bacteroidota bacterium]
MKRFYWLILCLGSLFFTACDKGELIENLPPETILFLDEINLSGDNRLISIVEINWLGEDQDGYVVGYEFSFDEVDWNFTRATDSVFRLSLPTNGDTTDAQFFIRAIDDKGLADPTPASLVIPIKNTAPTAVFDDIQEIPDTFYTVFSLPIDIADGDGQETIDSAFIKVNDGPWLSIDPLATILTIVPENPQTAGAQNAQIYIGQSNEALGTSLEGLELDGENTFYLRATDLALSGSKVDTSTSVYIKRQAGDLLVINDHPDPAAAAAYREILGRVYPTFDLVPLKEQPPLFWNPTFRLLINLYDKTLWFADGEYIDGTESLLLELASDEIQNYLNNEGKILISTPFNKSFTEQENVRLSPIFDLSPIDSLAKGVGRVRLPPNNTLNPQGSEVDKLDTLVSSVFFTGVDPFITKAAGETLYEGVLNDGSVPWTGPSALAARGFFTGNLTNQVFFAIEIHKLNADPDALDATLSTIFNDFFNW